MGRDKSILVVDDDTAIRALLTTVLKRRGLAVEAAANGFEAIERLGPQHAVVLLDLMMPKMSGYDVLEVIGTMPERPVVIVMTAGSELRDFDPSVVAGTIRKPFDIEVLIDTVSACVAAHPATSARSAPSASLRAGLDRSLADKPN